MTQSRLLMFILSMCCSLVLSSQIYLQLEVFNKAETIKYSKGEYIQFQKASTGDQWYNIAIQDILVDDGIILFENDFIRVEDISKVKRTNMGAQLAGKSLMTFALSYVVYGVIIELFTENEGINTVNLSIAAGAGTSGFIMNKIFGTKTYWIGKTSRMRIIDLRFFVPGE